MMTAKRIFKAFACSLALVILGSCINFTPSAKALTYEEFRGSNTGLRESYVRSSSAAPKISNIKVPSETLSRYDLYEITFQLDATYTNPFDPDDICVDGVFVYPSGKQVTIPAFFIEPMETLREEKTLMTYNPTGYKITGEPEWRIRFSGDEAGQYSFYITARDSKGQTCTTQSYVFALNKGTNKGYVDISKNNPSILINSGDGSPYYGSGTNMAWVRSQFTKNPEHLSYNYFIKQATGKTNMTRVWMCHWAWLEWMPAVEKSSSSYSYAGLGYYNQCISAAFDEIINMCEDSGMRIVLCTEDNDEHGNDQDYDGWNYNPYHIKNGGFVSTTTQYFRSAEVRQQYKKRLRYILARWGYSSALFSINMWNDMQAPNDDIVDYLKELRDYAHTITDGWRPLLYGSNYKMEANAVLDYTTQSIRSFDGTKPDVYNECYASGDRLFYKDTLRNTIWKDLCDGAAATMIWSHDDVDETGSWDVFRNVLDFTADFPFDTVGTFQSGEAKLSAATPDSDNLALSTAISITDYGDVAQWGAKATSNEFDVDESASGMFLHGYVKKLYGNKANVSPWRNPPTFIVDAPYGGEVVFYIDEIGGGTNEFTVKINGKTALKKTLSGGRRYTTAEEQYTTVKLMQGENRVTIDNTGMDWINVAKIYFILNVETPAEMITAHTHVGDSAAIVYLENQTYSEVNQKILGKTPTNFSDISFTLEGLKEDGSYGLYPFNPETGEYGEIKEVTVVDGKVDIQIPRIEKDYAVKLLKVEKGQALGLGSVFTSPKFVTVRADKSKYIDPVTELTVNNTDNTDTSDNGGIPWWIWPIIGVTVVIGAGIAFIVTRKTKSNEAALTEESESDKTDENEKTE